MTLGSGSLAPRLESLPWALLDDHLIVDGDALVIMDTCCGSDGSSGYLDTLSPVHLSCGNES